MDMSNIPIIQSQICFSSKTDRINRIDNQININNKKINALENQINAQKEVSNVLKELIDTNNKIIGCREKIITASKKIITASEKIITASEKIISNNEKIISSGEKLLNSHKEHRNLLQKSVDLMEKNRNRTDKCIQLIKEQKDLNYKIVECVEKMIAIMMKNPAKYGDLNKNEFQQLPETIETKKNLTEIIAVKSNQYPKEERINFMDTAEKVINRSLEAIDLNDLSLTKNIFSKLEKNIDIVFSTKQALLKNINLFSPLKNYRIAQNISYDFSNLHIKNFDI
jgi:hypothetical protein